MKSFRSGGGGILDTRRKRCGEGGNREERGEEEGGVEKAEGGRQKNLCKFGCSTRDISGGVRTQVMDIFCTRRVDDSIW